MEFPGGLVIRIPGFAIESRFSPLSGNLDPTSNVAWPRKKEKKS